jgi:chromosomal replication initiator protein
MEAGGRYATKRLDGVGPNPMCCVAVAGEGSKMSLNAFRQDNHSAATVRLNANTMKKPGDSPLLETPTWQRILAAVRQNHPTLVRQWFEDMVPRQLTNGVIQVTVPTVAQLNFCQSQLQQPFSHAAQDATGRLVAVSFHCDHLPRGGVFTESDKPLPLNPDYTFEQFVSGPCNRLAHAASIAVGDQPGKAYNPLFIHGGVGLGKSHLLQAISQKVLERDPDARILYLSCDNFVNQFINAVTSGDMNNFRNRYRNVDMLVIDDIHFLAGHDRTQEEFFHTFNTLHQHNKQIVLSSDSAPSEIPELEERLVSRFNWGLVAKIDKPCYETRLAILKKKAQMRGLLLPDDVVCYVAARIDSNTRELEGAITKLQGQAMLGGGAIDMELAKQALGEADVSRERRVTIQQILDAVIKYYNLKLSDLQSKKRNQSIAFPRQICMYLARKHTRYSLEEIGAYFGGRDHTTVLHGVRAIDRQMKVDRDVAQQVSQIDSILVA